MAAALCKDKLKKEPTFKYPHEIISHLNKFNNLQHQYTVEGRKSPSVSAALATAQSAIRRQMSSPSNSNSPPTSQSGLHLARLISKQARPFLDHKEFLVTKSGNKTVHKSLLDNLQLQKSLFEWTAAKLPGEVSSDVLF